MGGGGESTALTITAEEYEGNGVFSKNEGSIKLPVDIGASERYLNDRPGLRERSSVYLRLEKPREITTTGNHRLAGAATGIVTGCIIDQSEVKQQARPPVVVVPGIGPNVFSVPSAPEQGATTIFEVEGTRIETTDFTIPLQQVEGRRDLFMINIKLGGVDLGLDAEVNESQWHRCMDHINSRSLDLLSKTDANGVQFGRGVSPGDVFTTGNSIRQPRPKKFIIEITMRLSAGAHRPHGIHLAIVDGGFQIRQ